MPLIRLLLAAALAAGLSSAAHAQNARVVASCGTQSLRVGDSSGPLIDQAGNACIAGSAATAASGAAGGISTYRVNSAATTNAASVKGSAGRLYAWTLCNAFSAARYVRLFDLATPPTPGTTTPSLGPILVPAGTCQQFSTGIGLSFLNGIGLTITGANGDSDTTAVGAGDVTGFLGYQ